jgi:hypothetical protein
MHALGIIAFFGLFALYAIGQELSRRAAGIKGPSFIVRFHREAKPKLIGLLIGWASVFAFTWQKPDYAHFKMVLILSTVIVLLISLVRAVELPKDNQPSADK